MTPEELDKIAEIKRLAKLDIYDSNNIKIIIICEKIETDYKIEKRLEDDTDRKNTQNLVS